MKKKYYLGTKTSINSLVELALLPPLISDSVIISTHCLKGKGKLILASFLIGLLEQFMLYINTFFLICKPKAYHEENSKLRQILVVRRKKTASI